MQTIFAARMSGVHRSFIREILKVTEDPSIISFAGGLPKPDLFPVKEMSDATVAVLADQGAGALQYSTTEGHPPLREWIARRYRETKGLEVEADDILITTGSQQCLDLLAKVFLDRGDRVIIERPGYLGAIQAFSFFEPEFVSVSLEDDGPNPLELRAALAADRAKFFYAVPNFQNPSGVSYSEEKRQAVAELMQDSPTMFVEDDPYGELRFLGEHKRPIARARLRANGVLLGSFSKIAAPGFRIGWMVAPAAVREKLIIAKQASDLHTSSLTQRIMARYLADNDIDGHIARIRASYGRQREAMVAMIGRYFPPEVRITRPEGGMFLWATLPENCSSMHLFQTAIQEKVAFVPGAPFYVDGGGENTLRLNFSNSDEARIEEGIRRLARGIERFLSRAAC